MSLDLEGEIDLLYGLPLAEFVAARNSLSSRLKAGGDAAAATRVKALARPTVPSWAANQTYWNARPEFDAFVASTERLQRAQVSGESGPPLRDAMKARREAHAAVMARAESFLVAAGHGATPAVLRRVSETLEALAVESSRPPEVRPGRLVGDLEAPGFGALTQFDATRIREVPPAVPARSREKEPERGEAPSTRARALADARQALQEAERRLETARREARESSAAQSVAERRAEGARGELQEATRRLDRAKERAAHAGEEEAAARLDAEGKAAALEPLEAARDAARRAVRELE